MEYESPEKPGKSEKSDAVFVKNEAKKELAKYRKPFEKDWKKFDDAYYGKQGKVNEGERTVKNYVFKIIEGQVPTLTDAMTSTMLTATREEHQISADILSKAIKYTYQDQNLMLLMPTLMRSCLTSAPGYIYVSYNQDADGGDGKIEYRQLPWSSVYLDGNAQTIEQSEKCVIEIPSRRGALARLWPEKKDEIMKAQPPSDLGLGTNEGYETRDSGEINNITGKPKVHSAKDIVLYTETWVKDYDLKDIEPEETEEEIAKETEQLRGAEAPDITKWENHKAHMESHAALRAELLAVVGMPPDAKFEEIQAYVDQLIQQNPEATDLSQGLLAIKIIDNHLEEHEELKKLNPTGQEPKYEDGWRVIKSVENTILYDGENPNEDSNIPLVPFYCYKDDTIYGFGEVKNIIDPQLTLNDMDFRELENLRTNANSGWIGDHEAEVDAVKLTNAPGIVVLKKRGTELRRLEPGTVSPQLEQRKTLDQQAMDAISGQNEQSINDALPSGNASGAAINAVKTQSVGRIRLKNRGIEYYSMRRLAIITASMIMKYWTQEKELRLRSDDGDIESVIFNPLEMENLDYTVDISPGSLAGVDKDALIAFYMMLLNNQHIDMDMFLAASPEFPGKHTLVKLHKEKGVQQQQLQQVQQEAQAQIAQAQQQAQDLQSQIDSHKEEAQFIKQALNPDERKLHQEMIRQAAILKIENDKQTEQNAATNGQAELIQG